MKLKLHATNKDLMIKESERLISGSINMYTCEFTFDESWDGYTVTAVFSTNGSRLVNMAVVDGKCQIPHEVLRPNARIRVGIFGTDGVRSRPTTYSEWITVEQGTDVSGGAGQPPTPSVYEQWMNDLDEKHEEWNANEQARIEAENTRVEAESERAEAEQAREDLETGYVAQAKAYAEAAAKSAEEADINAHNTSPTAHADIRTELEDVDRQLQSFETTFVSAIKPEAYGAKGDGVTDDSAAIQSAIDAGAAQSMPVYLAKKNYKISTGLFIRSNYSIFRCDGTITYDGTGAAVTLTNTLRSKVELNTIYAENGTAVRLDNAEGRVTFCRVDIGNIRSSKVGVHMVTSNTENAEPIYYNKITYMDIVATEIGFHVEPIGGYINENRYYGGTIGGGCYYGFKLGNENTQYTTQANKILSGGLEGISEDGYGIYLENTEYNIFKNIRTLERYGKYLIGFVGNAKLNHIEVPRILVSEIDISKIGEIGNSNNVIDCMGSMLGDSGATGETIQVNGNFGIVYDTKKSNNAANTIKVSLTNFPDGVINPINNRIYSSFQSTVNSLNGQTITLGEIYYGTRSMLKGEPVVFSFGSGTGRIKLVDVEGNTIFDATDGKFDGKTISVKWSGYWGGTDKRNLWDISIEGQYGADGIGVVSVEQTKTSTEDNGENVVTVTLTDGTKTNFVVKNGSKGGEGYTPVKGKDYFTDADIQTIVNAVYVKIADGNGVAY